jgi:hypothetical protein
LSEANLSGANLRKADLREANFYCTNLSETCLDPKASPNQRGLEVFEKLSNGRCVGYRTRKAGHIDCYRDNRYYSADIFSVSDTECHPGLYLWPLFADARNHSPHEEIIRVETEPSEIHQAGTKWRCRWFYIVGSVTKVNVFCGSKQYGGFYDPNTSLLCQQHFTSQSCNWLLPTVTIMEIPAMVKKQHFLVSLEIPHDVTIIQMVKYIKEAVQCATGYLMPDDPMFGLNKKSVTVKHVKEQKNA